MTTSRTQYGTKVECGECGAETVKRKVHPFPTCSSKCRQRRRRRLSRNEPSRNTGDLAENRTGRPSRNTASRNNGSIRRNDIAALIDLANAELTVDKHFVTFMKKIMPEIEKLVDSRDAEIERLDSKIVELDSKIVEFDDSLLPSTVAGWIGETSTNVEFLEDRVKMMMKLATSTKRQCRLDQCDAGRSEYCLFHSGN